MQKFYGLKYHNLQVVYLCVYRPLNSSGTFGEKLTLSIEKANDISSNIIVLGDINVIFFNLSNTHEIHTIMNAYNLPNTIHAPTRIIHNTCSLIDPILVSKNIQTYDSGTISHTLSDHKATFIYIHNNSESNVSWDWDKTITDTNNIEAATKNFTNQYMPFIHKCIPEKTVTIRPNDKPWMDSLLRKTIRIRNRFKKRLRNQAGSQIGLLFVNTETRLTR